MANIAIDITVPGELFPFSTAPGTILSGSSFPRGRVSFRNNASAIAAKIATNTTSAVLKLILPPNFAYILEYLALDVNFPTDVDDAAKWDATGKLTMSGIGNGGRISQLFSEGIYATTLNAGSGRAWGTIQPYPLPLFSFGNAVLQAEARINDSDVVNATVAGTLSLSASYLQYDIEQIFNMPLNFPLPVQTR